MHLKAGQQNSHRSTEGARLHRTGRAPLSTSMGWVCAMFCALRLLCRPSSSTHDLRASHHTLQEGYQQDLVLPIVRSHLLVPTGDQPRSVCSNTAPMSTSKLPSQACSARLAERTCLVHSAPLESAHCTHVSRTVVLGNLKGAGAATHLTAPDCGSMRAMQSVIQTLAQISPSMASSSFKLPTAAPWSVTCGAARGSRSDLDSCAGLRRKAVSRARRPELHTCCV